MCPAMNTMMWEHPATRNSLQVLTDWGWKVVNPIKKVLACKEEGQGALAAVSTIRQAVIEAITLIEAAETVAAKTPIRPNFQIKSTASSRRCQNKRIKYLNNIFRCFLCGFASVTCVIGLYAVGKRFQKTYSIDV